MEQWIKDHPRAAGRIEALLARFPLAERLIRRLPAVRRQSEKETAALLSEIGSSLKPYKGRFETHAELPRNGKPRAAIHKEVERMKREEDSRWKDGYVSGAVYHGDSDHIEFLNKIYALQSQTNPLHFDLWPAINKFESEIISMTGHMLGARNDGPPENHICGSVSSGGTESILLAMKAYRDFARAKRGIRRPELVVAVTAHAAFDKAAKYFGIKLRRVPVGPDMRADIAAIGPRDKAPDGGAPARMGDAPAIAA